MPVSTVQLQRVLAILADEDQLKVTVRAAGYGGVVAGVTTTIGGLIAGPAGLLVGGALGGVLAYANAGDFKPVSQVIKEMNAHERQLLYRATKDIVDNLAIEDYLALLAFLNGGSGVLIRQQLMQRMIAFLRDQMRLQMATWITKLFFVIKGSTKYRWCRVTSRSNVIYQCSERQEDYHAFSFVRTSIKMIVDLQYTLLMC